MHSVLWHHLQVCPPERKRSVLVLRFLIFPFLGFKCFLAEFKGLRAKDVCTVCESPVIGNKNLVISFISPTHTLKKSDISIKEIIGCDQNMLNMSCYFSNTMVQVELSFCSGSFQTEWNFKKVSFSAFFSVPLALSSPFQPIYLLVYFNSGQCKHLSVDVTQDSFTV